MKILHTADWHLGKMLYNQSLAEEMDMFLQWLITTIVEEKINILLIAGDIFDISNPANSDKERYFLFLKALRKHDITTVIIGGNHDSISYLNASKAYLQNDNIFVIGGATNPLSEEILHFSVGNENITICAVPFLRDKDLRTAQTDQQYSSRQESIIQGITQHYAQVLSIAQQQYPLSPIIAMGHLFAIGADTSDSERDIYIGNTGAIDASIFNGFDYVALGHIHRPQIIHQKETIRYSGSPIALSFSEKKDKKQVVLLEITEGKLQTPRTITVPQFRALVKFSGNLASVKAQLDNYEPTTSLPSFIEINITEEVYDIAIIQMVNQLVSHYNQSHQHQIIHQKIQFTTGSKHVEELFATGSTIEDLKIIDVFRKKIQADLPNISTEEIVELEQTFYELFDQLHNEETI